MYVCGAWRSPCVVWAMSSGSDDDDDTILGRYNDSHVFVSNWNWIHLAIQHPAISIADHCQLSICTNRSIRRRPPARPPRVHLTGCTTFTFSAYYVCFKRLVRRLNTIQFICDYMMLLEVAVGGMRYTVIYIYIYIYIYMTWWIKTELCTASLLFCLFHISHSISVTRSQRL